eukprot:jgi/Chlat1/1239/Chrsp115S00753
MNRNKNLLVRMRHLLKSNAFVKPPWFDAVERVPPAPRPLWCPRPVNIVYPEDRFIRRFVAMHPYVTFQMPIDLKSETPHFLRYFGWRCLELMDDGHTPQKAYRIAEAEAVKALSKLPVEPGAEPGEDIMEIIQREEAEQYRLGMEAKSMASEDDDQRDVQSSADDVEADNVGAAEDLRQPPA